MNGRGGRREGAGRPKAVVKAVLPTKTVRVSKEVPNELYQRLPELLGRLADAKDEMQAARDRGESMRTYDKLAKLFQDLEVIGF